MLEKTLCSIVNQQNGNLAFKLFSFEDNSHFDYIQRNNFYTLLWITEGTGTLKADFSKYPFKSKMMMAFAPYQPYVFFSDAPFKGIALQFHSDFYCIHRSPKETNCDTVIFNNIYEPPFIYLDETAQSDFKIHLQHLKDEFQDEQISDLELLVPYLKIILIKATRMRKQQTMTTALSSSNTPQVLQQLKSAIEIHFKQLHSASDYAALLNITPNALAKIVKSYFSKTLTELISERIIVEAKRELYITNKTVKEIAYSLGYSDEFYFSRFFKTNTDVSPQMYRNTVGFGRAS